MSNKSNLPLKQTAHTPPVSEDGRISTGNTTVDAIIALIHRTLTGKPGVAGLALGGSWARGTATKQSDVDIGLFFNVQSSDQLAAIYMAIAALDDRSVSDPKGVYEWGPFNSPGFWLISGMRVDIALRDITTVARAIHDCAKGVLETTQDTSRLRGMSTAVFAAEIYHNIDFYDPSGTLAELRKLTDPYPEMLARALLQKYNHDAETSLGAAASAAKIGDFVYVYGCLYRAAASLNEVVFAANRRYLLDDKRATQAASALPLSPPQYGERMKKAFSLLTPQPKDMLAAIHLLQHVHQDTLQLH